MTESVVAALSYDKWSALKTMNENRVRVEDDVLYLVFTNPELEESIEYKVLQNDDAGDIVKLIVLLCVETANND